MRKENNTWVAGRDWRPYSQRAEAPSLDWMEENERNIRSTGIGG